MAHTKINTQVIPDGTIVSADLTMPITDFSSTGIDDNATSTAITINSSQNATFAGTITSGDIIIAESSPVLRIQDTDGTNQYTQLTNGNGNTYFGSRDDTADGVILIGGYGGNSFTEFARWAAAGHLTQKNNLTVQGAFTSLGIDDNATSTAITINSDEEVGVGATNPQKALHVLGGILAASSDGSTSGITIDSTATSGYASTITHSDTGIEFDTGSTLRDFTFEVSGSELMRIDTSSGNVGIGTSVVSGGPASTLHVHSSVSGAPVPFGSESRVTISTNDTAAGNNGFLGSLFFGGQDVGSAQTAFTGAGVVGYSAGDLAAGNITADLLFYTQVGTGAPTEKVRISSSGNVGIGATNPAYKLDIYGSSTTNIDLLHLLNSNNTLGCSSGIMFENYSGSGLNQGRIKYLNAGSNNSNSFVFEQEINATNGLVETMRINSSGNVDIQGSLDLIGGKLDLSDDASPSLPAYIQNTGTLGNQTSFASALSSSGQIQYSAADHLIADNSTVSSGYPNAWLRVNNGLTFGLGSSTAFTINNTGNVGIDNTDPKATLHVGGEIISGAGASTSGQVILKSEYLSSSNDFVNILGTQRSNSSWVIGYGVRPSPTTLGIFLSTADNSNFKRGALLIDDELVFMNAGAQTTAVDSAVTLTERMRINSAGNVGIGTTDIGAKLSVRSAASASITNVLDIGNAQNAAGTGHGAMIRLHCTIDENRGVAIASSSAANYAVDNHMLFYTSTSSTLTERMRINSSGNVSIGTTATNRGRLTVEGVSPGAYINTLALVCAAGSSKKAGISFWGTFVSPTADVSPRRVADITTGFSTANWGTEYMAFHVGTGASNDAMALNTERVRITGAGSVGIGIQTPDQKLVVNGNLAFAYNNTISAYTIGKSTDQYGIKYNSGVTSDATKIAHTFGSSVNSNIMSMTYGGNVLIGSTSQINANSKLEAVGSGNVHQYIRSTSLSDSQQSVLIVDASFSGVIKTSALGVYKHSGIAAPAAYLYLQNLSGTGYSYWSDTSGLFRVSTTATHIGTTSGTVVGTQTSDERLKTIEPDFEYGLESVKALTPIAYTLTADQESTRKLGFGAQTTQVVVPEAVMDTGECLDGYDQSTEQLMKQTAKSDKTKLTMEYVQLIPVLTKAIQELSAQVDELKAEVAALKGA